MLRRSLLFALFLSAALRAQSSLSLAGAGYQTPAPIQATPGQVLTVFVTGAETVLPVVSGIRGQWASGAPLPTTLAGFSATLTQNVPALSKQLPLFSVVQTNVCSDQTSSSPGCMLTSITLQLPSDMTVPNPGAAQPVAQITQLAITENGRVSETFLVVPVQEKSHIVTSCDTVLRNPTAICAPAITHADGTPVSASAPAKVGETLVMYVLGMGPTAPLVPEGQATPTPAPTVTTQFSVGFEYVNPLPLLPSAGVPVDAAPALPFLFVGLTPGQIGLYQVNFVVQVPGFSALSCPQQITPTNVTLALVHGASATASDTAKICVNTLGTSPATAVAQPMAPSLPSPSPFIPSTVWFPVGSNLTSLGQPLPPQSVGVPGPVTASPSKSSGHSQ